MGETDDTERLNWLEDNLWNSWQLDAADSSHHDHADYALIDPDGKCTSRCSTLREAIDEAMATD